MAKERIYELIAQLNILQAYDNSPQDIYNRIKYFSPEDIAILKNAYDNNNTGRMGDSVLVACSMIE